MDNFPLQNGYRIGIEAAADLEESDVDGESVEGDDMTEANDGDADEGEEQTASKSLGSLQEHLLEAKNVRVIRHLTDSSEDRATKHHRAFSEATRPLYFAIGRALGVSLPVRASKLELHNAILSSVRVMKASQFMENLPQSFRSLRTLIYSCFSVH